MWVRRWGGRSAVLLVLLLVTGCVRPVAAGPAVIRTSPPPWDAPRDAVSYIEAAGLVAEPMSSTGSPRRVVLSVEVDGWSIKVPPYVGIDRKRAQQAAAHTHDTTNQISLEGRDTASVTLGQFFTLWGVRFDARCLGSACGEVTVTADDQRVVDGPGLRLADVSRVTVSARS